MGAKTNRQPPWCLLVSTLLLTSFLGSAKAERRCWAKIEALKGQIDCQEKCAANAGSDMYCEEFCQCSGEVTANDTCTSLKDFAPGGFLEVAENMSVGSPLFEIPVLGGESWSYTLGRSDTVDGTPRRALQTYLKFRRFANKYEMVLDRPLDLEEVYRLYGIKLTSLRLELTCSLGSELSKTEEIFLTVTPVNEFSPEFINLPLKNDIPENTKVGEYVYILRSKAKDRDVNPVVTELSSFRLWKFLPDARIDGRSYFGLNDTQLGSVVLLKPLDYEALVSVGATKFILNVSASDVHGATTFTNLTLRVKDVDDLPPEFFHPGCPVLVTRTKPCLVSYEARVPVGYTGRLTNMSPGPVHARDMDSLNTSIVYSLESAPGESPGVLDQLHIDSKYGFVDVVSPFQDTETVEVVVVAREESVTKRSTQASLTISPFKQSDNMDALGLKSEGLSVKDSDGDSDEGPPVYLIVTLVVGLFMVITHLVICFIWFKLKKSGQERMRVAPLDLVGQAHAADLLGRPNGPRPDSRSQKNPNAPPPVQVYSHVQASEYEVAHDGKVSQSRVSLKYENRMIPAGVVTPGGSRDRTPFIQDPTQRNVKPSTALNSGTSPTASGVGPETNTAQRNEPPHYNEKQEDANANIDDGVYSASQTSSSRSVQADETQKPQTTDAGGGKNNNYRLSELENQRPTIYLHGQNTLGSQLKVYRRGSCEEQIEYNIRDGGPRDGDSIGTSVDSDDDPPSSTSMTDVSEDAGSVRVETLFVHQGLAQIETNTHNDLHSQRNIRPDAVRTQNQNTALSLLTLERASLLSGRSGLETGNIALSHNTKNCKEGLDHEISDTQKDLAQCNINAHKQASKETTEQIHNAETNVNYLMARPFTGPGHRSETLQTQEDQVPVQIKVEEEQCKERSNGDYISYENGIARPHTGPILENYTGTNHLGRETLVGIRPETGPPVRRKKKKRERRYTRQETRHDIDDPEYQNQEMDRYDSRYEDIAPQTDTLIYLPRRSSSFSRASMDVADFESHQRYMADNHDKPLDERISRTAGSIRSHRQRPKTSVRPDRSRLQPYMVLHIEKQLQEPPRQFYPEQVDSTIQRHKSHRRASKQRLTHETQGQLQNGHGTTTNDQECNERFPPHIKYHVTTNQRTRQGQETKRRRSYEEQIQSREWEQQLQVHKQQSYRNQDHIHRYQDHSYRNEDHSHKNQDPQHTQQQQERYDLPQQQNHRQHRRRRSQRSASEQPLVEHDSDKPTMDEHRLPSTAPCKGTNRQTDAQETDCGGLEISEQTVENVQNWVNSTH